MASRRCTSPASGPLDDDNLLSEILFRLPPKPSSLPRASLVCKRWRSIATDAAFRRRFRTHHWKSPILGVFEECAREIKFIPLLDPPDRIPSERFSLDLSDDENFSWSVLGCRHGRVLLLNRSAHVLLVFEPVSGDSLRILIPPEFVRDGFTDASGAVLCAAGDDQDHMHGNCHMSPFKVVLVSPGSQEEPAIACVYSQGTGMWMWGDLISTAEPCAGYVGPQHCTLVGNALYWYLYGTMDDTSEDSILKFDLDNQSLTVISGPPVVSVDSQIQIIRAEGGGFGLATFSSRSFQLWDCMVDCHGVATWVLRQTINMDNMLGRKADDADIAGYAEDADAILMSMYKARHSCVLIIVQLESMKVKEWPGRFYRPAYYLFTNFYTAAAELTYIVCKTIVTINKFG
ncbi:hypothetical protein ACQ4PT_062368 [Festuca glaucescens]